MTVSFVLTLSLVEAQAQVPFVFGLMRAQDPCSGKSIGQACSGTTALYAGVFDGGKYMVMPSGCADSTSNPSCAGTDTTYKYWRGSTGSNANIAGVTNVINVATPSSSAERGAVTTPIIAAAASVSSDSAADYCNDMVYGGFDDWALPSKSEMAYIYCKSQPVAHNPSFPQEDPNCVAYGGKTSDLTGFASDWYWTSTEGGGNAEAAAQSLYSGEQLVTQAKNYSGPVRCVRRY